jgi:hypothetical protein
MKFRLSSAGLRFILVPLALGFSIGASQAAAVGGLFNTGTNASNLALTGGNGVTDSHYIIQSSTSAGVAGQQAVTFFNSAYAPNDANSRWIALSASGNPGDNTTVYRTTFSLSGFDPATAVLNGLWAVDNVGSILLNGAATGVALTNAGNFSALTSFTLSTGFVDGLNTLDFSVQDFGPPTALRVDELTATATARGAVPVPASALLLGLGLVGLIFSRKR